MYISQDDVKFISVLEEIPKDIFVIGIDPGKTGGIVTIDKGYAHAIRMLSEAESCRYIFNKVNDSRKTTWMFIEKAFTKSGQQGMREYLTRAGTLMGALYATGVECELFEIAPDKWQALFDFDKRCTVPAPYKGMDARDRTTVKARRRAEFKKISRELASFLFPVYKKELSIGKNDGMSDALLITLYGLHARLRKI